VVAGGICLVAGKTRWEFRFRSEETTKVKKLVGITAILLCTFAVACGQSPNPLIGKWKLVPLPSGVVNRLYTYCATSLVFTDTTQTVSYNNGKVTSGKVHYVTGPKKVVYPTTVYVVSSDSANHQTFNFSSKDRMVEDAAAACTYQRD
jgi:hypothetical protein